MSKPIHIEGMGVQGCMLALLLDRNGIDFTWNDTDEAITAWRASTGAIYPSTSEKFGPDWSCHGVWSKWHADNIFTDATEKALWVYSQKSPPHSSKYRATRNEKTGLTTAEPPAFHLNAQKLVPETRERFADKRTMGTPVHVQLIVAHGWSERRSHSYWGWTRRVNLGWSKEVGNPFAATQKPSFYFREGRFLMCYAYRIPATPYWYAGSNIIKQKLGAERSLDMVAKYERWKKNFLRMGNGHVWINEEEDFIEGWRPACGDEDWVTMRESDGAIMLRPLWNSGIRHFPYQWQGVLEHLHEAQHPGEVVAWTPGN